MRIFHVHYQASGKGSLSAISRKRNQQNKGFAANVKNRSEVDKISPSKQHQQLAGPHNPNFTLSTQQKDFTPRAVPRN